MRLVAVLGISIWFGLSSMAQTKNVFHNRDFWKTNPSIEVIDQKIAAGNDVAQLNANAFDAVVYAILENADEATIKYLLSKEGNDTNKITHDSRTYIFWAAYKSNLPIVKFLLNNGARMDVLDSHGYSPMNFAVSAGLSDTHILDLLLANGAKLTDVDHSGANAVLLAAPYQKDFKLLEYFKDQGVDLNVVDDDGNGLFNYATRGGDIAFLEQLIEKGYSYKELNKHGGNAVMFASRPIRGAEVSVKLYQFLDKHGVKINVVGKGGKTPLHNLAYRQTDMEIFKFIISKGASANTQDKEGNTPFMNAARSNSLEMVEYLSSGVSNFNLKNKTGHSALTLAIRSNSIEISSFLLKKGADVNVVDTEGNSLAFYLVSNYSNTAGRSFSEKLEVLKSFGFQVPEKEAKNNTLYHLAVQKNKLEVVKAVSNFGLDINQKNSDGLTALHIAAMKAKDDSILKYLIEQGADKSLLTDFEESVYDLASENELLQEHSIDISFLN